MEFVKFFIPSHFHDDMVWILHLVLNHKVYEAESYTCEVTHLKLPMSLRSTKNLHIASGIIVDLWL